MVLLHCASAKADTEVASLNPTLCGSEGAPALANTEVAGLNPTVGDI